MDKKIKSNSEAHLHFAVLAVDVVLFTVKNDELYVRLIPVEKIHFPKGSKAFPGGLIDPKETAEEAVLRHLEVKAGISSKKVHIEQLYTFSKIDRDPRGRVVAVSYLALVPWEKLSEKERKDTPEASWSKISNAKGLAYDHDEMREMAVNRLRARSKYTTLVSKIIADEFTLGELERTYACILNETLDKRNFRKKILKLKVLKELPYKQTGEAFRPAQLYKFVSNKVEQIEVI